MVDVGWWEGGSLDRRNPGIWAPALLLTWVFAHCGGSHEKECEPLFECHCDESWTVVDSGTSA